MTEIALLVTMRKNSFIWLRLHIFSWVKLYELDIAIRMYVIFSFGGNKWTNACTIYKGWGLYSWVQVHVPLGASRACLERRQQWKTTPRSMYISPLLCNSSPRGERVSMILLPATAADISCTFVRFSGSV